MLSVKTLFEHAPSIPIYVISGFLGSGKTTFLQGLLAYTASQGLKPAILMNDYGDVSTDSDRLRGQGWPTQNVCRRLYLLHATAGFALPPSPIS